MFWQLVRFGVAGLASSAIYSAVYLPLTFWLLPTRLAWVAVPPAFLVAVTCGYVMHSGWSFRGHGGRDGAGARRVKFLVVQSIGMLLNAGYAWVLSGLMHQPAWVALIPAILVTPIVTFAINRQWVFS